MLGALPTHRECGDTGFLRGKEIAASIGTAAGLPSDLKVHTWRAGFATGTWKKRGDREEPRKAMLPLLPWRTMAVPEADGTRIGRASGTDAVGPGPGFHIEGAR